MTGVPLRNGILCCVRDSPFKMGLQIRRQELVLQLHWPNRVTAGAVTAISSDQPLSGVAPGLEAGIATLANSRY
jgi:hypothetical protein